MVCRPARLTFSLSADQRLALRLIGWTAWGSAHQPRVEPTQAGPLAAPRRVCSPRAPSGVVDVSALAEHPSVVAAVPAAQGGSPTGTRRGEDSAVSTPSRGVLQWVVVASRPRQPGSVLPAVPPPRWEARPRCRLWRRAELTVASTSDVLDPTPAAQLISLVSSPRKQYLLRRQGACARPGRPRASSHQS